MFQNGIASPESITRSFIAAPALLLVLVLVLMLVVGGLGVSGPVFLTSAIWLSILGTVAVGAFLIARAQRPFAGGGAVIAALAVWMAYFWRSNPGPLLWPVVVGRPDTWASLFVSGELVFGVLLALGLFTPIAAWGAMWLSTNIIMERGFVSHGAYVDKTYFVVAALLLDFAQRARLQIGCRAAPVHTATAGGRCRGCHA